MSPRLFLLNTFLALSHLNTFLAQDVDQCLTAVNKYRNMAGASSIGLCSADAQEQATEMATYDAVHGAHAYLADFGWYGFCGPESPECCTIYGMCSASGQGESFGNNYDEAINEFYILGPGEGHYDGMVSEDNTCVACGYSGTYYTFNWCNTDPVDPEVTSAPTPQPTQNGGTVPSESVVLLYESEGTGERVVNASEFGSNFNNGRNGALAFDVCAGGTFDSGTPLWTPEGSNVGQMKVLGDWRVLLSTDCGLTYPVDNMEVSREYSATDGLTSFSQLAYLEIPDTPVVTLFESEGTGKYVVNSSELTSNFNSGREGALAFDTCAGGKFDNGNAMWSTDGSHIGQVQVQGNWSVRFSEDCGLTYDVDDSQMVVSQKYSALDGLVTFFQLNYLEI